MAAREFDPFRLDVEAFAKEAASLAGRWPLAQLDRLAESAVTPPESAGDTDPLAGREVTWHVRGESRAVRGGSESDRQIWLHLNAQAELPLECQRCLKPVATPVDVERSFLFVRGEDAAAQLDADSEDDVLSLTRALDLRELIEDELLLALPLVPRHEVCDTPLPMPSDDGHVSDGDAPPHPFAGLAALKRGSRLN
ncbi:MAG TPA: YceD family protein [Burkholderiaceae bacterium]|nr:YceD family protein [Burkholderiaceae bacterium]